MKRLSKQNKSGTPRRAISPHRATQFAKEPPADATVCCGAAKSISIDDGVTYCKKCFQPVEL